MVVALAAGLHAGPCSGHACHMGSQPQPSNRWAVRAAVVGALVGAWFVWEFVDEQAQADPWSVGLIVAAVVGAGVGAYWLQERWCENARAAEARRLRHGTGNYAHVHVHDPRFEPDRSWVAPVAILCVAAIWGAAAGSRTRDNYVRPYCMYGAQSQAQLDGCMGRVTADDINRLDTQAARFARGDTSECLDDAGPFCADAAKWNTYEPPRPNE